MTTGKISAFGQALSAPGDLPEEIIRRGVVEQIEALLFAVVKLCQVPSVIGSNRKRCLTETDQRCTGHQQARDKRSDGALLRSVDNPFKPLYRKIPILIKVPWEVRRVLIFRVVLFDLERGRFVLETGNMTR